RHPYSSLSGRRNRDRGRPGPAWASPTAASGAVDVSGVTARAQNPGEVHPPGPRHRLGVDIGGTFTDLVLLDETSGRLLVGKVLTTPRDPAAGVLQGIRRLLARRTV